MKCNDSSVLREQSYHFSLKEKLTSRGAETSLFLKVEQKRGKWSFNCSCTQED